MKGSFRPLVDKRRIFHKNKIFGILVENHEQRGGVIELKGDFVGGRAI